MCQRISLLLFPLFTPINELPSLCLCWASKVLGAAVGLWPSAGDWKSQYLSPHWGPGRHWAPLPSLWNLSPLVTGRPYNAQSFVSDSIVGGRLRGKKGASPRDRKARWNKKVWLCGLKRAGMDQRAGCWPAAFVHQTALASFNLSLEAGKAHWDIVLHRSHALWGHLSASSATPPPIPLSPPPPLHLGQYHRWKWMGGVGLCFAPTCQGSTTKGAEPSLRMPGGQVLPYYTAFTWPCCLPALAPLGEPQHGGNQNREELSVAHLGMVNLSYVANKGELSGSLLHCLVGET